ncbi:hypothetical protein BN946_scf185043.g169 [Trametes cinnabarina]|uniref:Uncharacterized protein n=1 Tax=Pycnoporus cinnabarinus TaxID=5643 RepID=A0A060SPF4_PYCCI|nr:hypothetical protein BN946_scf185043.g169 [Trametes cinnabarina]
MSISTPTSSPLDPIAEPPYGLFIRKAIVQDLDVRYSWKKQPPGATNQLIDKILDAFPTFKKYIRAWPVQYYSYQSLCYWRSKPEHQGPRRRLRYSARTCLSAESARVSPAHDLRASVDIMPTSARGLDLRIVRASEEPTLVGPSTHYSVETAQSAAKVKPVNCEQEVLEFLVAIDMSLAYLHDRFVLSGLTSKGRLQIMARWAPREVDEFLFRVLQLSEFERKLVSDALVRIG